MQKNNYWLRISRRGYLCLPDPPSDESSAALEFHNGLLTKMLRAMKLAAILLFVAFMHVKASVVAQNVTISAKNISLKQVFNVIEKQTGYVVFANEQMLANTGTVSVNVTNAQLQDLLDLVLRDQPLGYTIQGKTIFLSRKAPANTHAWEIPAMALPPATGRIVDADGQPLAGVNIIIMGTHKGATTAPDGSFSLNVSEGDVLQISFVGFVPLTLRFANGSFLETATGQVAGQQHTNAGARSKLVNSSASSVLVSLALSTSPLDEIQVVGYGTQRKGDITGAISSVNSNVLKDQPVTNLQGALEGKTAGVQITQNSGAPGAGAQVRIRGLTSINNSDPLYVVDGIPLASNDINIIDPSNIESIDILKDASAQAIYGSRGANGVVLIKTKRGNRGEAEISFGTYQGVAQVRKKMDMVSASDYVMLNNEAYKNANQPSPFTDPPAAYTRTTDWQDELFRNGYIQNYNLAISGGGQNIIYRVSGNYLDQQGTIVGSDYNRINVSNNITFNPKPGLEFGESLAFNRSVSHSVATEFGANVINDAFAEDPTIPVKDENGNYTATKYSDIVNPLAKIHYLYGNWPYTQYGLLGNTYLQYKPVKGLTLKTSYSLDLKFSDTKQFTPTYNVAPNFNNPNARLYRQKDQVTNWTWDNTATYEFELNNDHHFNILAGMSAERFTYNYINASNQGQPGNDPYLQYLDAGISNQQVGGSQQQWGLLSYMGRLNYNFRGTYFLTATLRRDGSSKFGSNNKYGNFPSASLGWNITNESFFPKNNKLTYLKVRGSWGIVGNQASVGYYDYSAGINTYYYAIGAPATAFPTADPAGLANPDLKWEQVQQWNAGFDYSLFDDRLTGSFDYYQKKTKDMLLNLNILSVSGFTQSPRQNAGTMQNSGIEFSADYKQSISKDFNLSAGVHFATIRNRVLDLVRTGQKIYSGNIKPGQTELTQVGHPVASFYGYVTDGIFQTQEEVNSAPRQQAGTAPGDFRFRDLNGDKVINENDQTFLGSPIPKLTYGFNLRGNYKNFDFSMFFSGVYGNKILAAYKYYTDGFFISNYNMETEALGRWTGPGTSNTLPRLIASDPNNNSRVSDFYLESGSYLRLQNLTIGYTIPKSAIKGIKSLRVYAAAQNLLTFTKYKGYDPEIGQQYSGSSGTLDIGVDNGTYPQSRTFSAGVNLSF